jgi:hypothetical protein
MRPQFWRFSTESKLSVPGVTWGAKVKKRSLIELTSIIGTCENAGVCCVDKGDGDERSNYRSELHDGSSLLLKKCLGVEER